MADEEARVAASLRSREGGGGRGAAAAALIITLSCLVALVAFPSWDGEKKSSVRASLLSRGTALPVMEPLQNYDSNYKAVPYLKPLGLIFEKAPVLRRVRAERAFMMPVEEARRPRYVVQPFAQRQVESFAGPRHVDGNLRQKEISDILDIIRDSAELRSDFESARGASASEDTPGDGHNSPIPQSNSDAAESNFEGVQAPRRKWAEENHDWARARFAGRDYYGKDKKNGGMPDISNMFGMSQSATRAAEGASVAQKAAQIVAEQGPASPPLEDEAQGGAGDEGKDYGDRELSEGATKNTLVDSAIERALIERLRRSNYLSH